MSAVKERVDVLIEAHCETRAVYRRERTRVAVGELSGMPDPGVIADVETRLTRVYSLLHEASGELAAISAELADWDFDNEGNG
jgi:hypothetical protein